jgi:hypothetical protein
MVVQSLTEFLALAGEKPYRKLVEHHIRRQSSEQIQASLLDEVHLLPVPLQRYVEPFIDVVNARVGHDQSFWAGGSCRAAADTIADAAAQVIPQEELLGAFNATLRDGKTDLSLGIFQIATLNFALSASLQREQRKFMCIRKGLFR